MLTQTITYTDYNDVAQTEKLYFNLNQSELADMMHLLPILEKWDAKSKEENRDLSTEEALEFLKIIKELIEASYGERSEDGKRFIKSPELYREFTQTAAYDAFLMELYQNDGDLLVKFMTGVIPQAALQEAMRDTTSETVELPQPVTEEPAYIRENRLPTPGELQAMTPAQLQEAFRRRSQ